MRTSRKLAHTLLALLALLVMAGAALAAEPGLPYGPTSEVSDQKVGSLLYYNIFTSNASTPGTQDTYVAITNSSATIPAFVHFFLVDGSTCGIADNFVCLTQRQTYAFLTSNVDPGTTGYIVAIAVDFDGLPTVHNFLMGDEYVKFETGHRGNLGAEAFSKLTDTNVVSTDGSLAALFLDGLALAGSYNRAPRVLALDNIPSRTDGNDTLLIVNRVGGNLAIGAATLGTLFGRLFDDAETAFSFDISGSCQLRRSLANGTPHTVPPLETVIPSGHVGWLELFSFSDIGIIGASINYNPNTVGTKGAFNGAVNLHKLTLSAAANLTIPIFEPSC